VSTHEIAAPVKKPLFTPGVFVLLALMAIGFAFALARFLMGFNAVTNLNDQYPWGIWIAIDVATGVALAAGGFTSAALAHIFHREHYEAITRPALLTALLGYTFVVLGLLVDLGRYYNVWHPMLPMMWSGHSVLFEVGMCVMVYLTVLYIEFVPMVVERFKGRVNMPGALRGLNRPFEGLMKFFDATFGRAMFIFIIMGVVLSCLHQSSLGGLMLLAKYKMHALWWTPILPLLFLLSAISVGYPMVIFESMIASRVFGRKPEMHILAPLGRIVAVILFIYFAFKIGDMTLRGTGKYLFEGSAQSTMFILELGLGVVLPMVLFTFKRARNSPRLLFTAATLVVLGVAFNRINVFLTAYTPVYKAQQYFPSIGEIAVTVGLMSGLMFVYRVLVTIFPILPREEHV
jgi:Ni/Fe-hydrogenase subunit HybB-like protein